MKRISWVVISLSVFLVGGPFIETVLAQASGAQDLIDALTKSGLTQPPTTGTGGSLREIPPPSGEAPVFPPPSIQDLPTDQQGNPTLPEPVPPTVSTAEPKPETPLSAFGKPKEAGVAVPESTLQDINEMPAGASFQPVEVRGMLGDEFAKSGTPSGGINPQTDEVPAEGKLSQTEVFRLRYIFVMDTGRHEGYASRSEFQLALQVSLKWQAISKLFPQQIEEITGGIAKSNGFPNFPAYIEIVIQKDWAKVK